MTQKSKSKTNPLAELHFVASSQLEQSVRVISNLADDDHWVTLTEINPDEYQFEVDYIPERMPRATLSGTLQRWNGTETKVNASGHVKMMELSNESIHRVRNLMWSMTFAIIVALCTYLLGGQLLHIFVLFSGSVALSFILLNDFFGRETSSDDETGIRARDYLFQQVIDTFKSAGDIKAL